MCRGHPVADIQRQTGGSRIFRVAGHGAQVISWRFNSRPAGVPTSSVAKITASLTRLGRIHLAAIDERHRDVLGVFHWKRRCRLSASCAACTVTGMPGRLPDRRGLGLAPVTIFLPMSAVSLSWQVTQRSPAWNGAPPWYFADQGPFHRGLVEQGDTALRRTGPVDTEAVRRAAAAGAAGLPPGACGTGCCEGRSDSGIDPLLFGQLGRLALFALFPGLFLLWRVPQRLQSP